MKTFNVREPYSDKESSFKNHPSHRNSSCPPYMRYKSRKVATNQSSAHEMWPCHRRHQDSRKWHSRLNTGDDFASWFIGLNLNKIKLRNYLIVNDWCPLLFFPSKALQKRKKEGPLACSYEAPWRRLSYPHPHSHYETTVQYNFFSQTHRYHASLQ